MIMSLFPVVGAVAKPFCTVIHWTESKEAVLQGLLTLSVPLIMPYHLLLLNKHLEATVDAVIVFTIAQILAMLSPTLGAIIVPEIIEDLSHDYPCDQCNTTIKNIFIHVLYLFNIT